MAALSSLVNCKSGPANPQIFSFPSDVISHLWKHPLSTRCLLKLHQTCKYVYSKKPVLLLSTLKLAQESFMGYPVNKSKTNVFCYIFSEDESNWNNSYSVFRPPKWEDLTQQVWLTNNVYLYLLCGFKLSQKVYRCTIRILKFYKAVITFQDFCFLTEEQTIEVIKIKRNSCIYYCERKIWRMTNKEMVPIDVVISRVPKLQELVYWIKNQEISQESFQKLSLIKLQNQLKFVEIIFFHLSPSADLTLVYEFIKMNAAKDCKISLPGRGEDQKMLEAALTNLDPKNEK